VGGKCTRASLLGSQTFGSRNDVLLSLLMDVSGMDVRDAYDYRKQIANIGARKLMETKCEPVA
jgi:hypothetical protein